MKVVILAAGYGTRLYPLTLRIAKPLLPVNKKPMINYLIDKIEVLKKHFPIEEIRIVVNDKFYGSFLKWKKKYKVQAKIINDGSANPDDRRGAVGDIKFAIKNIKTDWLVLGGDNLFDDNLINFVRFALKNKPHSSLGLYDVRTKKKAARFGIVKLNKKKRVVEFLEKPKNPPSTLAASCVYFFPEQSLNLLKLFIHANAGVDASGKYIEWLSEKDKVFGWTFEGRWIDIGHLDSLRKAGEMFRD
ncbi:MAG: nucleotidyltransferase family protein [Candidatus Omnitrophota bacterium]